MCVVIGGSLKREGKLSKTCHARGQLAAGEPCKPNTLATFRNMTESMTLPSDVSKRNLLSRRRREMIGESRVCNPSCENMRAKVDNSKLRHKVSAWL